FGDAYHFLAPSSTLGNCPAPTNGGTTAVGCRFVLDLMVNGGSSSNLYGHQSYMTVTSHLIKNARVAQIATACVLTNTVTTDFTIFDAVYQNENCNGTGPNGDQRCNFRGVNVNPGSYAFASAV